MLKIGDFSRLAQVSVKALRYYDELGLLKPVRVDRFTAYRYYALEQLPRLHRILALKDLGLSLDDVKRLLDADVPVSELRGMLKLRQADLQAHLRNEQARLARVEARLAQLERGDRHGTYDVVLKSVPELWVASMRTTLPRYAAVGAAFDELAKHLQRCKVAHTGAPLAIYYDSEYRDHDVDVEVALPVNRGAVVTEGRVTVRQLPSLDEAACVVHAGPMPALLDAYAAVNAWVPANAYRVDGPAREVYLSAPAQAHRGAPGEPEVVVEVQIPIKSALKALSAAQRSMIMEPKIVSLDGITVVGVKYVGNNEHGEISAMWDALGPRWSELEHPSHQAYGVCRMPNEEELVAAPGARIAYLAGAEQRVRGVVPAGMEAWTIPAGLYAVFPCTLGTIHEAYTQALDTWLPASKDYVYREAPDFELYPPTFEPESDNQDMFIYVPIKAR